MSDFTALGAMVALGIANAFLFVFMDRWVNGRGDTIATGVVRGVRISARHRRYVLQVRLILNAGTLIVVEGVLAIGWLLVGGNASPGDLKLFAYLVAFIDAVGAVGWLATMPSHCRHLAAVMRESETN
jgi:hypothetical protein